MTETTRAAFKPLHFRIITLATARRLLHVEDALDVGRIRFELWAYERGNGATGSAHAYVPADDARLLADRLAAGVLLEPFEASGGGTVRGQLLARLLRFEETEDTAHPFRLAITTGPGERLASGLIALRKGARAERVQLLLSRADGRRLGLALREHLLAWAVHTYGERVRTGRWQPAEEARRPDGGGRLCYGDGTPVGENAREAQAFGAYLQFEAALPPSRETLRQWVRARAG